MTDNKRSRSGNKPGCKPLITIDDCVQRAKQLSVELERLSEYKYPLDIRRGIKKEVKEHMHMRTHNDRPSKQIKGSGRTFFLDIEESREGKPYLRITESRKGKGDTFERNSINVFPEDADTFAQAVSEMISKIG